MNRLHRRSIAVFCAVACAAATAVSVSPALRRVRTEDRNRDGRPDVWRRFAGRGQPIEVDIDSNFDGRPDIQEYYQDGALVRRESDRNFDDRVDLVEEFDRSTREHVRSVVDIDYDGRADLLVLFRDGRPVYSDYASSPAVSAAAFVGRVSAAPRHGRLMPLADPFRASASFRTACAPYSPAEREAFSTSTGLLPVRTDAAASVPVTLVALSGDRLVSPTVPLAASPRAPPLS